MRKVAILLLALALFPIATPGSASPKVGSTCKKVGQVRQLPERELICKKSGQTKSWRINTSGQVTNPFNPDPRPSGPVFKTDCDLDPLVPKEWEQFQQNLRVNDCAPPYRYLVKQLVDEQPQTSQTPRTNLLPIEPCKLRRHDGWYYDLKNGNKLNPKIVVQIIPFATTDFPANSDPRLDWKVYVDFIVDSLTKMTDVESNYQFRIAPKYFKIDKKLTDYGLSGAVGHGDPIANPARYQLARDVISVADGEINFSDVNKVFFFSPTTVPRDVLANHIGYGQQLKTDEKTFFNGIYISSYINDFKSKYWIPREPFGFIHEMMHIFATAEDYYGDVNYGGNEVGTGNWGNMSGARTDHLIWDKWNAQMISDDQVRCADKTKSTIHWLKPSTISGKYEKLLMIPINQYEGIVVESIRNSGFNFKIPTKMHGALVYRINTQLIDDNQTHGDGVYVLCPSNRTCSKDPDPAFRGFRLATATLKLGDYLDVEGIRIKLLETGDYGDVVSVTPRS